MEELVLALSTTCVVASILYCAVALWKARRQRETFHQLCMDVLTEKKPRKKLHLLPLQQASSNGSRWHGQHTPVDFEDIERPSSIYPVVTPDHVATRYSFDWLPSVGYSGEETHTAPSSDDDDDRKRSTPLFTGGGSEDFGGGAGATASFATPEDVRPDVDSGSCVSDSPPTDNVDTVSSDCSSTSASD